MLAVEVKTASFPTAHCADCERTVLTYLTLDENGAEIRACAHCGQPVTEDGVQWVDSEEIEEMGYFFGAPPQRQGGGCGSGGGCSSCSAK